LTENKHFWLQNRDERFCISLIKQEKEGKGALGKKLDALGKIGPGRAVDLAANQQQSNLTARDFQ
jgi:hypothetical protein